MAIRKMMKMSGVLCLGLLLLMFQGCTGNKADDATFDVKRALTQENIHPVIIIGDGVAGLSAAIYTGRGMVSPLVIQGNRPGGLLTMTTEVENWPGERSIQGPDLIDKMRKHAQDFGAEFLPEVVEKVDFSSWPFKVYTSDGVVLQALTLIVATGATPAYLGIPGEKEYIGRGVGTCAVCDAAFYKEKKVAIVGGGDSAIEEAIQFAAHAQEITILVRKESMRAAARMQERLKEYPSIKVVYNVEVKKVVGDDKHVTHLEIYNNKTKQTSQLPIDGMFLAIGHIPNSAIVSKALIDDYVKSASIAGYKVPSSGMLHKTADLIAHKMLAGHYLETDSRGFIKPVGRTQKTSVKGVFVAGEVADSRYRQAIVESGQGASAALDALAFLSDIGFNPTMAKEFKKPKKQAVAPAKSMQTSSSEHSLKEISTVAQLEAVAKDGMPVILDFYGSHCIPCKQIAPLVAEVAQEYSDKVRMVKVNGDSGVELVEKFLVTKVPYFIAVKNGKLIGRFGGRADELITRQELRDFVEEVI